MNNSRSFDRAASYYDQTRPLPESIAKDGIQAILNLTGMDVRALEVGAGTGRITIPLLERGLDLVGCDLSSRMLMRLREKSPTARIAQSDAAYLPFSTASFDVVLTVHVLHLVPSWREALRDFRRVLVPGGAYLNVKTWGSVGVSIRERLRLHWRDWLATQDVHAGNPGLQGSDELQQELHSLGAQVTEVDVLRYPVVFTLREQLDHFENRIFSDAWDVPDAIFDASIKELRSWVQREYEDLDQQHEDEVRFSIDVARFVK